MCVGVYGSGAAIGMFFPFLVVFLLMVFISLFSFTNMFLVDISTESAMIHIG